MTGDVTDVTFDNVKYGQNRATNDAELPLIIAAGARAAASCPSPAGPVARFTVDPPVFAPGEHVTFTAQTLAAARNIHGSSAMEPRPTAAREAQISRRARDRTRWSATAQADSAFCSRPKTSRIIRIGPRREWWPWPNGTTLH